MARPVPTIQEHMTPAPVTVAPSLRLAEAAEVMRVHAFRHLPVVHEGRLVGLLSERDIDVARSLRSRTLATTAVSLVMNDRPLVVEADTPLADAAVRMIDRGAESAVVVHAGRVVGIFTTQDALLALHRHLAVQAPFAVASGSR